MNRVLLSFTVLLVAGMLGACGRGPSLSEEEAKRLLNEHMKLPAPQYSDDRKPYYIGTEEGEFIEKLIREGYVHKEGLKLQGLYRYIPTDKGEENDILGISFSEDGKLNGAWPGDVRRAFYLFSGPVVRKVLKSIDKIAIDQKTKTALVMFSIRYEPHEPYYSELCKGTDACEFSREMLDKTESSGIKLKYHGHGWRVLEE